MNEELALKHQEQLRLAMELETKIVELSSVLSYFDWTHVCHLFHSSNELTIRKVDIIQNNKLAELINLNAEHNPNEVIYNYSNFELTDSDMSLLCKGLGFAIPQKNLKYCDYILPFELLFRDIKRETVSNDMLNHLQAKVKDIGLSSLRYYNKADHKFDNLTKEEYQSFLKLSQNNEIIIQKADKGNTVVILDRNSYISKIEELLSDTNKFRPILFKHSVNKELRHLLDMEEALIETLDKLLTLNYLSNSDYNFLKPSGSKPGVLYGLCKVHKKSIGNSPPFRPILSSIGTCTYKLAKFFVPLLSEHSKNEFTLKDSFSFAEDIAKQNVNLYMASFDVDNLFTNIPLDETIEICVSKLFEKNKKIKGFKKSHCRELLHLATKQSAFIFNNKWYTQIDGVAMGSPLGPTLANIFLGHFEKIWLEQCPDDFKPVYYKRYVDDIITLFNSQEHVEKFKMFLNSRHKNMSFSSEEEKDNKFNFLDIQITRKENKIVTSIYRKPTFSGVYTNFKSFIPMDYKHGLIFTLLFRTFTICADYSVIHEEIKKLKCIWLKNGFPLKVIDKCIFTFFNKLFGPRDSVIKHDISGITFTISLPFLGCESLKIKKQLQTIVKTCCKNIKLRVIFNSKTRLSNLFNFKDKITDDLKSLVLYKYTCRICKNTYLGKCKRHFKVRRNEHLNVSYKTEKPFSYNQKTASAVSEHIHTQNHIAFLSDFKIIGAAKDDYCLKICESLLIHKERPILNKTIYSVPLALFNT